MCPLSPINYFENLLGQFMPFTGRFIPSVNPPLGCIVHGYCYWLFNPLKRNIDILLFTGASHFMDCCSCKSMNSTSKKGI